jgi:YaiO family outer membrane protein
MHLQGSIEALSNGTPDWTAFSAGGYGNFGGEGTLSGRIESLNRFGLANQLLEMGYDHRVSFGSLGASVIKGFSAVYVPKQAFELRGDLHVIPNGGLLWSWRENDYRDGAVRIQSLGFEQYGGVFRWVLSVRRALLQFKQEAWGGGLRIDWAPQEERLLFVSGGLGEESFVVAPGQLRNISVGTLSVGGKIRILDHWSAELELTHGRQGGFFVRNGGRIGVALSL